MRVLILCLFSIQHEIYRFSSSFSFSHKNPTEVGRRKMLRPGRDHLLEVTKHQRRLRPVMASGSNPCERNKKMWLAVYCNLWFVSCLFRGFYSMTVSPPPMALYSWKRLGKYNFVHFLTCPPNFYDCGKEKEGYRDNDKSSTIWQSCFAWLFLQWEYVSPHVRSGLPLPSPRPLPREGDPNQRQQVYFKQHNYSLNNREHIVLIIFIRLHW